MFSKDQTGEAGYTFTSNLSTFTSYTFPFEVQLNGATSRLYSTEKGKLVFQSYATNEIWSTTNMTSFVRDTYTRYSANTAGCSMNKYSTSNTYPVIPFNTYYSEATTFSSVVAIYTTSSTKDYIATTSGALITGAGLRHNHTTNKTELVLLGKTFDWYTDSIKFPVKAIKF